MVVNYNGGDLTERCLDSISSLIWPQSALEVVVVDNGSRDGSDVQIERRDGVRLVRAPRNLGFGGAVNLALSDLNGTEYVALVNNDAVVERDWLRLLVESLERDLGAGAASPKVLLSGAFAQVELETETHRRGRGDHRALGVRLEGVRVDGSDRLERTYFASGFHGLEREGARSFQWTGAAARLYVPLAGRAVGGEAELLLSCDRPKTVSVASGESVWRTEIGRRPIWLCVRASALEMPLLNSAGAVALEGGYGSDRGYLEPDRGQYDAAGEVFGWSGCAVLLRSEYLQDVGVFDETLFLYYEDFDLSWRGRARGWRHLYVPGARVWHVHEASAGTVRRRAGFWKERNRLVVHVRNAPAGLVRSAYADALRGLGLHVIRDVSSRVLHAEQPDLGFVATRLGALGAACARLPATLPQRTRLRRAQTATDHDLLRWVTPRTPSPEGRSSVVR